MGQKVKSYQRKLRVITGNDNEKASVGFKAFGLRTEVLQTPLDCWVLKRGRGFEYAYTCMWMG